MIKIASLLIVLFLCLTLQQDRSQPMTYKFDRGISRKVLENYLSKAVTHVGLCQCFPESSTLQFEDDLRMLKNIGAKFIGRAAYAWKTPPNDAEHFKKAAERAALVHKSDPDIILQACIFEAVFENVGNIPVPEWVFTEFREPFQHRNFQYAKMLYNPGPSDLRNHWELGGSVPDISKLETRMWFYYRAKNYIDAGFESIHFGQVELMGHNDNDHYYWQNLLTRIRKYALSTARRHWVLCDSHTHGLAIQGKLLFDFHSYPLRIQELSDNKMESELRLGVPTSIYRSSLGGLTPSGWRCDSLPYLVELDSWGASANPGEPLQQNWIWGYDEICWFAHQESENYRNEWLRYASSWVHSNDPNGWFQMPTRRNLAVKVNGVDMYHANTPSANIIGYNQEITIKEIWGH